MAHSAKSKDPRISPLLLQLQLLLVLLKDMASAVP